jgi:hypothetical protein
VQSTILIARSTICPFGKTSLNLALCPLIFKNNKTEIMKKFFLTTGILMVMAITATYAQDNLNDNDANELKSVRTNTQIEIQKEGTETNQNAVSVFTVNQFAYDFPDVTNIHFDKTKDYVAVTYSQNGRSSTAYYDDNSELMGTMRNRSIQDLPAAAQKEIADRYPGYSVARIVRFNANSDNETYIDNNSELPFYDDSSENNSNYFVELNNDKKAIVLIVGLSGEVSFFSTMKLS